LNPKRVRFLIGCGRDGSGNRAAHRVDAPREGDEWVRQSRSQKTTTSIFPAGFMSSATRGQTRRAWPSSSARSTRWVSGFSTSAAAMAAMPKPCSKARTQRSSPATSARRRLTACLPDVPDTSRRAACVPSLAIRRW